MSEKYQGLIRLHEGEEAKSVANDLGVSLAKVLNWNRELQEATQNNEVQKLLALNDNTLNDILEDAAYRLPEEIAESVTKEIKASVNGLKVLETDLQSVAKVLVQRVRTHAMIAETPQDVHMLAETVCLIQKSFFATGTNINIQQNNRGSTYGEFLKDTPGVIVDVKN